ncbi:TraE/TraK family type IV conjugative transfer system protein [Dickeya sp. NCPPB 3274]|uniref:TraE/TraK family type IV conjugative transfer system protein n=1 Tax=Dickeya sp. NCPPB 3274 TaxID=568766 RepID=UPI0005B3DC29|nr:TraE/TraK family type IV conjugative transfer system protein [Dickeya sp. NCPPB 3274]
MTLFKNKKTTIALNDQQRAIAEKKKDRIILYIILGLCAVNYYNNSKALQNSRIVVSPFGAVDSGDYWVTAVTASDAYVGRMAQLVLSYYNIVSPSTVERSYTSLLSMTHPLRAEAMRQKLEERKNKVKNFTTVSFTSEIVPDKSISITTNTRVDYDHARLPVFRAVINVTNKKIIGSIVEQPESSVLVIDYVIENGRWWLMDING